MTEGNKIKKRETFWREWLSRKSQFVMAPVFELQRENSTKNTKERRSLYISDLSHTVKETRRRNNTRERSKKV